jgi:hypothetical protein
VENLITSVIIGIGTVESIANKMVCVLRILVIVLQTYARLLCLETLMGAAMRGSARLAHTIDIAYYPWKNLTIVIMGVSTVEKR